MKYKIKRCDDDVLGFRDSVDLCCTQSVLSDAASYTVSDATSVNHQVTLDARNLYSFSSDDK